MICTWSCSFTTLGKRSLTFYIRLPCYDTQFVHTGTTEDIHTLVKESERTLTKVKEYFHYNGLVLNTHMTQCMFIGTRGLISQIPGNICVHEDGTTIVPNTSMKNLEVYFDSCMQFDAHISQKALEPSCSSTELRKTLTNIQES